MRYVTKEYKTLLQVFLVESQTFVLFGFFFYEVLSKNQYLIKAIFLFPDYCSRKQASKGYFNQWPAGGV